ncbi:VaFE repeat-containing surface-anchored protein [Jonesiaceae bacterium BS-20]|uniref:VaFE repeat-containing surface-anchored protein n=1 Tax=Jonesiaceae bacterium BS-20 TaxID=3120821 RepID=A0AAU7DQ71_9MICO
MLKIRPKPLHLSGVMTAIVALLMAFFVFPTVTHADELPPGFPVMGRQAEAIPGLRLAIGNSSVATHLFPVYTREVTAPDQLAYCVELSVDVQYEIDLNVSHWNEFPGRNNFADSLAVRQKVAWIVNQSFPGNSIEALRTQSGIRGLTVPEAIAGTQAAIWSFTDSAPASADYLYTGISADGVPDSTSPAAVRVGALVDYLTGDSNTGVPEVRGPSLSVSTPSVSGQAGGLVGPFSFQGSAAFVELTSSSTYPVVFADGSPADLAQAPTGTDLFLKVPSHAPANNATISATLSGPQLTGMLVTNTKPRTQTLMISRSDEVQVHASLSASWIDSPRIGTSARAGDAEHGFLPQTGPTTVTDTVLYENLIPGKTYEVSGELMIKDESRAVPTGITATKEFIPQESSGQVELVFEVPENVLVGQTVVVFERLYQNGIEVATHTDIEDANQTVYRPTIETDAYDLSDFDQELDSTGGTLRDDVAYSGLRIGERYVLRGQVMDHETGEPTGIYGQTEFVATQSAGIAYIDFTVPAEFAGKTLVVFEYLFLAPAQQNMARQMSFASPQVMAAEELLEDTEKAAEEFSLEPGPGESLLAVHTDLDDERQTVTVDEPPTEVPPTEPPTEVPPTEKPPAEVPPTKTTGKLAKTGSGPVATVIGASLVLLLAGAGTYVITRRKAS